MNFYTSDHHFGHKAIVWMCKRPFADITEMNEELIKRWNEKVTNDDTVYHLGDLSYKLSRGGIKSILERLNGKIVLIKGNHDSEKDLRALSYRFEKVENLIEIKDEFIDRKIVLCHYPIESWRQKEKGVYHLHGHSHQNLLTYPEILRIDAGVEGHNYYPISSLEVQTLMEKKVFYEKYYKLD